jgi:hypothetical protein
MARIKKIVLGLHYIFFLDNRFFFYILIVPGTEPTNQRKEQISSQ